MIFHENRLTILTKYHALFVVFEMQQNLKLSSAANYGYTNLKISSDTLSQQLKLCYLDNRDEIMFTYAATTIDAFKTIHVRMSHFHHSINTSSHIKTLLQQFWK